MRVGRDSDGSSGCLNWEVAYECVQCGYVHSKTLNLGI